jgi:hypothetical protein
MMTTHSGSFQKFEFEIYAGISSNTLWSSFWKTKLTVDDTSAMRPSQLSSTRQHPLSPRCPPLTGLAQTPAGGRWKSSSTAS